MGLAPTQDGPMRVVEHTITCPPGERVALHHITDLHAGAPDFAEEALRERLRLIEQDPLAVVTLGGDHGDLINHRDRRYSITELHPRYRQATDIRWATLEHLEELLSPVSDKIIALADGNHERKMDEHHGGHFGVELAVNLGVANKFVDYRGFVTMTLDNGHGSMLTQLVDVQHGWQAGRTRGAAANQAEKDFSMTDASIVLRGHSHRPQHETLKTMGVTRKTRKIVMRPRTYINGGSWRLGYRENLAPISGVKISEVERSMWHETKGFRIEDVGGPVLLLWPDYANKGTGLVQHTVVDSHINSATLGL